MTVPSSRSLLSIASMQMPDILTLLTRAEYWRGAQRDTALLHGKQLQLLFFESSTRTRTSFEAAALRLGASVLNVSFASSSLNKGETLYDTLAALEALKPDGVILRHSASGAAAWLAKHTTASVINAGDGMHEHPTQALLDAFTLQQHLGELAGKRVAIVGDIRHSRVARSNLILLPMLGVEVRVVAPTMLLPLELEKYGVDTFHDLQTGLAGCDAVMVLRLQQERMAARFMPPLAEYSAFYGLHHETLAYAKEGAVVLHPGPINRGVEISSALADDSSRCLLLKQVENGLYMRMAVLEYCLTGVTL